MNKIAKLSKLLIILFSLSLFGCSTVHAKTKPNQNQTITTKKPSTFTEFGLASYYGDSVNGHKTANGEIFHNKKLTAAHKKLPFGSLVKVTALWNGKSVIVRINDRGPYPKGRIIDLSKSAAEKLNLVGKGIGKVKIELINQK